MDHATTTEFLLHMIVSGLAVFLTAAIIPGIRTSGFLSAFFAALALAAANAILWPLLFWLTLPITLITLGLFLLILNGAMLKLASAIIPGFEVTSWLSAIVGAIVLSVLNYFLHALLI